MEAQKTKKVESNVRGIKNAFLVIVACFIIAECMLCLFIFKESKI